MATKKVAAKKPAAAAASGEAAAAKPVKRSKADLVLVGKLQDAGVELTGTETTVELEALIEEHGLGEDSGPEVIDGVPNTVPVRFEPQEPGSKNKPFPIWHVMAVKGGFAMYDHKGRRVSHLLKPDVHVEPGNDASPLELVYHRKVAARSNAQRKAVRLPNDPD